MYQSMWSTIWPSTLHTGTHPIYTYHHTVISLTKSPCMHRWTRKQCMPCLIIYQPQCGSYEYVCVRCRSEVAPSVSEATIPKATLGYIMRVVNCYLPYCVSHLIQPPDPIVRGFCVWLSKLVVLGGKETMLLSPRSGSNHHPPTTHHPCLGSPRSADPCKPATAATIRHRIGVPLACRKQGKSFFTSVHLIPFH